MPPTAACGGTPFLDKAGGTCPAALKCRDPDRELSLVTFARDRVTITPYLDGGIRTTAGTWAGTVRIVSFFILPLTVHQEPGF